MIFVGLPDHVYFWLRMLCYFINYYISLIIDYFWEFYIFLCRYNEYNLVLDLGNICLRISCCSPDDLGIWTKFYSAKYWRRDYWSKQFFFVIIILPFIGKPSTKISRVFGSGYINHRASIFYFFYKTSCVLRTLWLVSYRVYIRLCKHGCDITACFPVLFYKRNRKWTPRV